MTDISIVVGSYNRPEHIRRCVESVIRETRRPFKLYITDAGSDTLTIDYLKSVASERIIPIFVGKKLGQARAYNDVFKQVDSPFVCWISDDNEIIAGGLDLAAEILDSDPRIGMVGLKVKDVQGPFVAAPYIGGVSEYGILNVNQGMLRTELLSKVGYFSEVFQDYGIDPDLTAKVLLSGYDIVYTKPVVIRHYRLWEIDRSSPEYEKMQKRQEAYLARYRAAYGGVFAPSKYWKWKTAAWKHLQSWLGGRYRPNSSGRFLRLMPRDWNNIFSSRFISLLDPALHFGKKYHLRQRAPRKKACVAPGPNGEALGVAASGNESLPNSNSSAS